MCVIREREHVCHQREGMCVIRERACVSSGVAERGPAFDARRDRAVMDNGRPLRQLAYFAACVCILAASALSLPPSSLALSRCSRLATLRSLKRITISKEGVLVNPKYMK